MPHVLSTAGCVTWFVLLGEIDSIAGEYIMSP